MTALRLISLPVHGALEMLLGLALMTLPFALGMSPAGVAIGVVAGAAVVGLSLGVAAPSGDRPAPSIATHHAFDQGLATGMLGAAVVLAAAGQRAGAAFLTIAGLAQLALTLTTRYSRAR